jgi:hypothetical protein
MPVMDSVTNQEIKKSKVVTGPEFRGIRWMQKAY